MEPNESNKPSTQEILSGVSATLSSANIIQSRINRAISCISAQAQPFFQVETECRITLPEIEAMRAIGEAPATHSTHIQLLDSCAQKGLVKIKAIQSITSDPESDSTAVYASLTSLGVSVMELVVDNSRDIKIIISTSARIS